MGADESDEDAKLFREAMRDVKPLRADSRASGQRKRRRRPRATHDELVTRLIDAIEAKRAGAPILDDPAGMRRRGVSHAQLRALARARVGAEDEIDLHGMAALAARAALIDFLASAAARGRRFVRIVHGKGLRSGPAGPVLRGVVAEVLASTEHVLATRPAPAREGGSGATHVLLSRLSEL